MFGMDLFPGYNDLLIVLSYLIAVFGSYTALQLTRRIGGTGSRVQWSWLAAAAFAMGGGAIWSMHFIGMLAMEMNMVVTYDIPKTVISLLAAIVLTALGLYIVASGSGKLSWARLVLGGTVMGAGIVVMHYLGMYAMRMRATFEWDNPLVALSIVIAVVASIAALWLAFNMRRMAQMIGSALVMGVAVCGMHYTGMAAATMVPSPAAQAPNPMAFSPELLAYSIFLFSLVILTVGLAFGGSRVPARAT